jgi:nucleotide-binding universal stress UspA family protein
MPGMEEPAMTYRSILVLLDASPLCAPRTRTAIGLARSMDCHLVGIAPTGLIDIPPILGAKASLEEFSSMAWDTLRAAAGRSTDLFRHECRSAGLRSFEAVVDEFDILRSLVRHAHCSDLCVLSQADPADPGRRQSQELLEQFVLFSARPTLIVPYTGGAQPLGTHAMVAWDDSREAARALSDALPLLRHAKQVDVVRWNERGASQAPTERQDLDALQKWLMWQGVQAEVHIETTEIGIADAMLSRCADMSVDLLVMGAYGHARLTERVLGGATRGLLASMTVPVLMSH